MFYSQQGSLTASAAIAILPDASKDDKQSRPHSSSACASDQNAFPTCSGWPYIGRTERVARSSNLVRSITMSTNLRFARLSAVAAALLIPAVSSVSTAAYADDMYGVATEHGALIRQSAESAPSFSSAFAMARGQKPGVKVASNVTRTASDVPAGNQQDLVGNGGQQDKLAREIYHPGSGTDW
jgi:hypothetical protein